MSKDLEKYLNPLIEVFEAMPWEDEPFYKEYLAQTYYYTFHSCRMLALAAAYTDKNQNDYFDRSVKHIAEEYGHENLALADLKRMGGDIKNHPELATTKAFWESQYYKIGRSNVSLLGYILSLEWLAVRSFPVVYERVKKAYGAKCTNFIRVHAEEDPDHVDKCFQQISNLGPEEKQWVHENYTQSCRVFSLFMNECKLRSDKHLSSQETNQAA